MSREYKCDMIGIGKAYEDGETAALCRMADTVTHHATAISGPHIPAGHRVQTSPVIEIVVSPDRISVRTQSGSLYWMPNEENMSEFQTTGQQQIREWLSERPSVPIGYTLE